MADFIGTPIWRTYPSKTVWKRGEGSFCHDVPSMDLIVLLLRRIQLVRIRYRRRNWLEGAKVRIVQKLTQEGINLAFPSEITVGLVET